MKKMIIIIIVLILCISMTMIFCACDFFGDDNSKTTQSDKSTYNINTAVSFKDGVWFKVKDAYITKSINGVVSEIKTNNQFVVVKIRVANNSGNTYNGSRSAVWLDYSGIKIEQTTDVYLLKNGFGAFSLSATLSNEYIALFETADNISLDRVILIISNNNYGSEKTIGIKLV